MIEFRGSIFSIKLNFGECDKNDVIMHKKAVPKLCNFKNERQKMNHDIKDGERRGGIRYELKRGRSGKPLETQHHGYYEIYYLSRGSGLYLVGNRTYNVDEGDVLLIPDGVEHRTIEADENRERHILTCRPHLLPRTVREKFGEGAVVVRAPRLGEVMTALFAKIAAEYNSSDAHAEDALECCVKELMILLARSENSYSHTENNSPAVAAALAYVKERFADRISLPDAARVCKVSVAYLSRKFKEEMGIGFSDYLSRYRLGHAAAMLRDNPDLSITEVAFASGFNDSNYFSDKFKRQYGSSPIKFKRG